ncbi:restriction endonuclease subunit S [Bremerella sp. P1]|uniref:restriction endonuclease subunit S n=1 Tax=Bremerella sp. P1 TaxID=3026424 RepID=UPI0023686CAA|nr:restriction endonuclease subunit S [Bremerella sp. P1]WDI45191.1 restriction endonuclease subunit S [Bremerella sp. P1]
MERVQLNERELTVATLEQGDLLFARSSLKVEGTGKCSLVVSLPETTTFESHLIRARLERTRADSRFYFYFFQSYVGRATVLSIAKQVGAAGLAGSKLADLKVPRPPLDTQVRIADVLTAYDDLIDNNQQRMSLLEESARLLFEEWFVRLRFPGHEHTRIVKGIPEGWERRPLGDCAKFLSGGTPRKSRPEFWEGHIPWISSKEMTQLRLQDSSLRVTQEGAEQGTRLVPTNTILAVVRGMSLAKEFRVAVCSQPVTFNQDLKALVAVSDIRPEYLFASLVSQRDQIRDRATEASHGTKKLDTPVLSAVPILVAPERLQRAFCDWVVPMNKLWDNCWRQNQKLREARDLLLPRLMSGEVAA